MNREYTQNKTATKDDPIFQSYIEEGDVFITRELMAIIMCMPHSVKSFDFIVTKDYDGKLWIDLRDESDLCKCVCPLFFFKNKFKISQ